MNMTEWAENEVKLACKRERGNAPEKDWDYGRACYQSALKAFKSLCEDGHSGVSISMTKNILDHLIDGKCLTPIEDTEDVWNDISYKDGMRTYQCKRMSSLFKDVYPDGTVKYNDVERVICYNCSINDDDTPGVSDGIPWNNGFTSNIIHEMFPITMPYTPANNSYKVYREEFLFNKDNGDYDTIGLLYVIDPEGNKTPINRYFKDSGETMAEIDKAEYLERRANRVREEKGNAET